MYGVVVDSEFPFTTVAEAPAGRTVPDVTLRLGDADFFRQRTRDLPPPNDDWVQYTVLADGAVFIRVETVLQTVISADGRHAVCAWLEGADRTAFEANFLNFVLSTALTLQGEEPFHSTVLDLGTRVIGLLGTSGAGKSTLAACLIRDGADLVTDDMLRLLFRDGVPVLYPGPYRLKLVGDSAERFLPAAARKGYFNTVTGKILVRPRDTPPAYDVPRRLDALFWVGDHIAEGEEGPDVRASRMGGAALIKVLLASAMNVRYPAPERLGRRLRFVEHVARAVPVYALEYRRDFGIMSRVVEEIHRVLSA